MYNPANFTLSDMTECGATLRKLGTGADSMEEVADRIVSYFYSQFLDPQTNASAFTLVRFFKTHSLGDLPMDLRAYAQSLLNQQEVPATTKCLTLLSTQGDRVEWHDGHQWGIRQFP